jgi:hypothetical protein
MCVLATDGIGRRLLHANNLGKVDTIVVVKSIGGGLNKHGVSTYDVGLALCHTSRTLSDPLV